MYDTGELVALCNGVPYTFEHNKYRMAVFLMLWRCLVTGRASSVLKMLQQHSTRFLRDCRGAGPA